MAAKWYAQFRKTDNVVVSAGFLVDPEDFRDADHEVSVGFDGDIPVLNEAAPIGLVYLWKYDPAAGQLVPNT